jgi:hypothetical protein
MNCPIATPPPRGIDVQHLNASPMKRAPGGFASYFGKPPGARFTGLSHDNVNEVADVSGNAASPAPFLASEANGQRTAGIRTLDGRANGQAARAAEGMRSRRPVPSPAQQR